MQTGDVGGGSGGLGGDKAAVQQLAAAAAAAATVADATAKLRARVRLSVPLVTAEAVVEWCERSLSIFTADVVSNEAKRDKFYRRYPEAGRGAHTDACLDLDALAHADDFGV